jgi:hypothetical protein
LAELLDVCSGFDDFLICHELVPVVLPAKVAPVMPSFCDVLIVLDLSMHHQVTKTFQTLDGLVRVLAFVPSEVGKPLDDSFEFLFKSLPLEVLLFLLPKLGKQQEPAIIYESLVSEKRCQERCDLEIV